MTKKASVEIALDHKAKNHFFYAGNMSIPSVKDACGYQARDKPNVCTQKIAMGLCSWLCPGSLVIPGGSLKSKSFSGVG
jgi:hypothetical protein